MIQCDVCGQLFILEMDSCPICNKTKRNTEQAELKLLAYITKLRNSDISIELKQILINMENMICSKK